MKDSVTKMPKTSSAQAPTDMGDQYLKLGSHVRLLNSMCQKRLGRPRSRVRSNGQITIAGNATRKARRATPSSRVSPARRSSVPIRYAPPASPPKKKYQTMYHSHCGGATKC